LAKAQVIIYSRPGCHLCNDAKHAMLSAGCSESFTLEEINIETSRDLLVKYQFDIPVVTINGVEAFKYRVNQEMFKALVLGI
jgi:glutaredoxin